MHKLVSQLVVYRNLPADNLLEPLAAICAEFAAGDYNREELTAEIYEQVHKLLGMFEAKGILVEEIKAMDELNGATAPFMALTKIFGTIIWLFYW